MEETISSAYYQRNSDTTDRRADGGQQALHRWSSESLDSGRLVCSTCRAVRDKLATFGASGGVRPSLIRGCWTGSVGNSGLLSWAGPSCSCSKPGNPAFPAASPTYCWLTTGLHACLLTNCASAKLTRLGFGICRYFTRRLYLCASHAHAKDAASRLFLFERLHSKAFFLLD